MSAMTLFDNLYNNLLAFDLYPELFYLKPEIKTNGYFKSSGLSSWSIDKDGKCFVVLPGYKKENVNITVEGNVLNIDVEPSKDSKFAKEKKKYEYVDTENIYDLDKTTAELEDGVLMLGFVKKVTAEPKKIHLK